MAIQTTRWSPDTCGCVHEYQWDDAVPIASRTHTHANTIIVCPEHQALGLAAAAAYAAALENNQRKNVAADGIKAIFSALTSDQINWTWDAQRNLTITTTGLAITNPQKNTIQTALNTRFGTGKVTLIVG